MKAAIQMLGRCATFVGKTAGALVSMLLVLAAIGVAVAAIVPRQVLAQSIRTTGSFLSSAGGTMTGPIYQAAGTATLPSYSFAQNTHQGMYSVNSSRLGLTGGASVLELDINSSTRMITAIDAFLIAGTGTSPALDIAPSGSTATGLNMRSDNITKFCSIGVSGTEYIGCYNAASTATMVVNSHGANSPALQVGGALVQPPGTAVVIGNPTDTTSLGFQACSFCKMSAAANTAWTPAETNATPGMKVCFQNTAAFTITMTASANVYVGPGSVVGQNDVVCMVYTDSPASEWIETDFQNNP